MLEILLAFVALKAVVTIYSALRAMPDIVRTVENELP